MNLDVPFCLMTEKKVVTQVQHCSSAKVRVKSAEMSKNVLQAKETCLLSIAGIAADDMCSLLEQFEQASDSIPEFPVDLHFPKRYY